MVNYYKFFSFNHFIFNHPNNDIYFNLSKDERSVISTHTKNLIGKTFLSLFQN